MKVRLLALVALIIALLPPTVAAQAAASGVAGRVIDAATRQPVADATVLLLEQGRAETTDVSGRFSISGATPGAETLIIAAYGYADANLPVIIPDGTMADLGEISLQLDNPGAAIAAGAQEELLFDQSMLDDEEGNAQSIGALTGASDNVYYSAASYDFSAMRFRLRGYDSQYTDVYINGMKMNDLARGRFNYSSLGGLNRAFRNRTNTIGLDGATYGMGDIGGSANISTITSGYAPGFNGSVAYTNANYMLRAMAMYSTGINDKGWGLTVAGIGRWADEGIIPGTFYNSGGLFLSLEKQLNPSHSINLTAWGAPTQRATSSATYLEAYDLADNNLYNPNWGWQDGKKRSSKIVETFDPTFMLNWIYKSLDGRTNVNTSAMARWVNYYTSALNWYNAADPRPDYYRYLPSYYKDNPEAYELYTNLWRNDESFRQINWDALYQTNYLNNAANGSLPEADRKGSTYILENRHSNQFNVALSTLVNHRLNSAMTLQGGASVNYTDAHYYKSIRDLLGGEFWLDIDQFAERDFPNNPSILQNNLNDPNRRVGKGDTFGYDYNIRAIQATAWLQNMISLPHWEINYGLEMSYTQFQRDGHMRNGRAPLNSYGKGDTHRFDNGGIKAGATYKLDGRNFFQLHAVYESRAPLFEYSYISPRIKDDVIDGLQSERVASVDISYSWLYRRFRGSLTAFYTDMRDQTERTSFYDDQYSTFMNYVLKGVNTCYKGIELGAAYKLTPSVTASVAATVASYRYKNRPTGVRSYENGMMPDTATTVYLKNYHIGGTPQTAVNIGIDWAAPHSWFFGINASYMGNAYVNLTPVRHEALSNLWTLYPDEATLTEKIDEITTQEKLNDAFTLNASIGKIVNINRKVSMNFNLSVDNILNKRNIMTYGYQQGRFDYTNFDSSKYPNKYYYAQGIKVFLNVGVRF